MFRTDAVMFTAAIFRPRPPSGTCKMNLCEADVPWVDLFELALNRSTELLGKACGVDYPFHFGNTRFRSCICIA